jgi:hypothetical protein
MSKLTKAQLRMLSTVPDDWAVIPNRGDQRPLRPLMRAKMIEDRQTDVTPEDWGAFGRSPVRLIKHEWRITDLGRSALGEQPEVKE